jgi:hypothetical protein
MCARVGPHAGVLNLEVADVLRDHARSLTLSREQQRVVRDIVACRTEWLGGHRYVCDECGFACPVYNSCRNRHCPQCQLVQQELWAEAQERLLLPCRYFHVVFTLAAELHRLFRLAPQLCLTLLFESASETLHELARSKRRVRIGFTTVLHTWTQLLKYHPHIHCIVPGGGLTPHGARWKPFRRFFLRVELVRDVFRGKLLDKLERALRAEQIPVSLDEGLELLRRAAHKTWVVNVKAPLAGPQQVVRYLSRYAHRIAISNSRLVHYDMQQVTFRYKDRAHNQSATCTLPAAQFCQRFLQHVLPDRFMRIRHYGLLAARCRPTLALCRRLLGVAPPSPAPKETWQQACLRLFGRDPTLCPKCQRGHMLKGTPLLPFTPMQR